MRTVTGLLTQDAEDRFGPAPASERLRPGSPHPLLMTYGEPWWWAATGGLLETVMTGQTAFDRIQARAGFRIEAVTPTAAGIEVMSAVPV